MAYFAIEDFKGGLDTRRNAFTSVAGTLQALVNAHITRGGDIEKRKAFVSKGALRDNTFGLASDLTGKAVFGSDASPSGSLPSGVRYVRLQAPTGADMTGIQATEQYGGKLYVVANYDDGSQWHFYDGELVTDWGAGEVLANMTTNDLIAEHLKGLIDAHEDYSATRIGAVIEVIGPTGIDYTVDTLTENVDSGVDDQTLSLALIEAAVATVEPAQAFAEFAILSGSVDAANYVDAVRVDDGGVFTDLIAADVLFTTSPEYTAAAVAAAINSGTGTHGYDALAKYGKVFVYAPGVDGDTANGRIIEVTAKGNVVLYNGSFTITGGSSSAGVNKISSVKANGLEILGTAVDWTTDNAATAAAVAAQICANASSPKYNAYAEGNAVFVSPEKIRSDDASTISLTADSAGDVTLGPSGTPQVVDQYPDYGETGGGNACVYFGSHLPSGHLAGEVVEGDTLQLADPVTLEGSRGVVSYSQRKRAPCYRIVTDQFATLICSESAPIPVQAGGYRTPQQLMGHKVAVRRDAPDGTSAIAWEQVMDVVAAGNRDVQHITVGDANFWAGQLPGVYLLHHNRKAAPEEGLP